MSVSKNLRSQKVLLVGGRVRFQAGPNVEGYGRSHAGFLPFLSPLDISTWSFFLSVSCTGALSVTAFPAAPPLPLQEGSQQGRIVLDWWNIRKMFVTRTCRRGVRASYVFIFNGFNARNILFVAGNQATRTHSATLKFDKFTTCLVFLCGVRENLFGMFKKTC